MNLDAELHKYAYLRGELLRQFPELEEDEAALLDTLEGATTLNEAIVAVWESARADDGMAAAIGERIAELQERKARLSLRADKKRAACCDAMQDAGLKKIEAPEVTLSVRHVAPSVVVTDEGAIPADYWREKVSRSIDKTLVKQAINDGHAVPGAMLGNGHVTISARVK